MNSQVISLGQLTPEQLEQLRKLPGYNRPCKGIPYPKKRTPTPSASARSGT